MPGIAPGLARAGLPGRRVHARLGLAHRPRRAARVLLGAGGDNHQHKYKCPVVAEGAGMSAYGLERLVPGI